MLSYRTVEVPLPKISLSVQAHLVFCSCGIAGSSTDGRRVTALSDVDSRWNPLPNGCRYDGRSDRHRIALRHVSIGLSLGRWVQTNNWLVVSILHGAIKFIFKLRDIYQIKLTNAQ